MEYENKYLLVEHILTVASCDNNCFQSLGSPELSLQMVIMCLE